MKYLLIGNPNVGKTTFYNALTGKKEKVSNFEGVTVSKKISKIKTSEDYLVDLPGINDLGDENEVSRSVLNTLIEEDYAGIFYIADINNLRKNMYLLFDILETGKQVNLILNMTDIFKGDINIKELADFGFNVYENNKNIKFDPSKLIFKENKFKIQYDEQIEKLIKEVLKYKKDLDLNINDRFLALQIIRGNKTFYKYFNDGKEIMNLIKLEEDIVIKKEKARSMTGLIFRNKRELIIEVLKDNYSLNKNNVSYLSSKFDQIALHKFWGYILFFFILWIVFSISFLFTGTLIEAIMTFISTTTNNFLNSINAPIIFTSFIIEGILAGITGVVVFLPQIIILFTFLTFLEGSGYLTRVSVLFENLFNKLGLSSGSIIPLISGLGCNVLSIMGTRNIKNEKKRIATIFASPFVSCSARLPVYMIFIDVFFVKYKGFILLSLYILGIVVAVSVSVFIDKIIYKNNNKDEIEITVLPTYKMVGLKYFLRALYNKVNNFVVRAGKLIVVGTIIVWILTHFNIFGYTTQITDSILYTLMSKISFIFIPLGFGTPEASSILFSGFFAKEMIIANMNIFYGTGSQMELAQILGQQYNLASAYSFMVFTLLYIPCISTLGVIYSETGSKKITIMSVVVSLSVGYMLSFIIYNLIKVLMVVV